MIVDSGGLELVMSGGFAYDASLEDGGNMSVGSGGSAQLTAVSDFAEAVATPLTGSGSAGQSLEWVSDGSSIDDEIDSGAVVLTVAGGVTSRAVVFDGGVHSVAYGGIAGYTTVSNGGTQVVIEAVASGTVLTALSGAFVALSGIISGVATVDARGRGPRRDRLGRRRPRVDDGTLLTLGEPAPSFATGTRISTTNGLPASEDLAIGDRVITMRGQIRSIRWIGRRSVDCASMREPGTHWPVRIRAGAFGRDLPLRDLWLTSGHHVFVDGLLVPAQALINKVTVSLEPVESYRYIGNRRGFDIGAAVASLFPATLDPDLRLFADGKPSAADRTGNAVHLTFEHPAESLRIVSRAACPIWSDLGSGDTRRLGFAVSRTLAGGDAALDVTGMRRLSLWIEAQSIYPVEYPSADTRAARQRLT